MHAILEDRREEEKEERMRTVRRGGGRKSLSQSSSVTRQGLEWRNWDINPAPKPLNYSLSCLQSVLQNGHQRDQRNFIQQPKGAGTESNIRWNLKSPEEEGQEGLEEPEASGTPREHGPQNQLTGTNGSSQVSGNL